jgi:hypothetical protein
VFSCLVLVGAISGFVPIPEVFKSGGFIIVETVVLLSP